MRSRFNAARLPLVPAEVAGLVLVLLAALILGGGVASSSGSARVGVWVLVAGLFLLLGAALATVLIGGSSRRTDVSLPLVRVPPESVPGASWEDDLPEKALTRRGLEAALPTGEPRIGPARPISSSIPGAYLSALDSTPGGPPLPLEESPPIAAALPLAAMPRAPVFRPGHVEEAESAAVLEVELARLRARLLEIEGPAGTRTSVGPRLDVSGGSRTAVGPPMGLEGRPGVTPPNATPRDCADCGRVVGPGPNSSLCSSCGRLLCVDCAPRAGTAGGLLYCPRCAGRREAPTVSGGRAGPPVNDLSSGPSPLVGSLAPRG